MRIEINGEIKPISRDLHWSDCYTSNQDRLIGDYVASEIGDLYIDFNNESPVEQWTKVMKALRIHGIDISIK